MKRLVRWSMRGGMLALLALAVPGLTLPVSGARKRVYVIDASASVATPRGQETFTTDDALRLATHDFRSLDRDDVVALVAFGAKPAILVPLSPVSGARFPTRIEGVDGSSTDLAAALETAAALADGGEIVFFSDGRSTAGRVPVERIRVPVNAFPLGPVGGVDASIRSIDAPATVPPGAEFQIRVAVESTGPWRGELAGRPLEFTGPGRQDVVMSRTMTGEELKVTLKLAGSDVCPENDAAEFTVWSETRSPRVMILGPESRATAEADVVVIDRLRADAVPPSELTRLAALVRDGGAGLVMLGGSSAFALGGWGGTPVEDLLPFWAFPDERSAVVILLDRSGSMAKSAPGRTRPRIVEAAAAVRRALQLAHPDDELALVTFAESAEARCPLVAGRDRGRVAAALEGISAGGTTVLGKALDLAAGIAKGSKAGRRRLLVVSDGESIGEEGDLRSAARLLQAEGIGVTIVRTGDSSTPALAILRDAGAEEIDGSDFARLDDAVSAAFARTRELTGPPPGPLAFRGTLSGLSSAPAPEWIHRVSLKQGSEVLAASGEVPVAAIRPAGRGRAAACAFPLDSRPDRAELMSRLVEAVAPPSPGLAADVSLRFEDDRLEIAASLRGPDRPDRFEVAVDGAPVGLVRRGENTYVQTLRHIAGGAAVRIGGRVAAAARRPHPREFERVGPDAESLRSLAQSTGGAFLDAPSGLASLPGRGPTSTRSARPLLLGAALALFLLDVALALLWRA